MRGNDGLHARNDEWIERRRDSMMEMMMDMYYEEQCWMDSNNDDDNNNLDQWVVYTQNDSDDEYYMCWVMIDDWFIDCHLLNKTYQKKKLFWIPILFE